MWSGSVVCRSCWWVRHGGGPLRKHVASGPELNVLWPQHPPAALGARLREVWCRRTGASSFLRSQWAEWPRPPTCSWTVMATCRRVSELAGSKLLWAGKPHPRPVLYVPRGSDVARFGNRTPQASVVTTRVSVFALFFVPVCPVLGWNLKLGTSVPPIGSPCWESGTPGDSGDGLEAGSRGLGPGAAMLPAP